ncbi:MAG: class I SAM-dependent methyltransferase [Chloroflexi bacterium]|nr:class I SAM-dependent methyltransferase [Chloroflexota bacterium]
MMPTSPPLRVAHDDPAYQAMASAEAAFWATPHPYGLEAIESRFPNDGPVERNANQRFTGDARTRWYEVIPRYGQFRKGLLLGTSALSTESRILETNPLLTLTIADISEGALGRRRETLGARFPGRVRIEVADLNFLDPPSGAYDLVVSASSLHHVTNLESCAYAINRCLAPGGHAFVHDYVGEPRFQFSGVKKRLFELIWDRNMTSDGLRGPGVTWMDDGDLSPFCGRRSDETLAVMRAYLDETELRTRGALVRALQRCTPSGRATPHPLARARRVLRRFSTRITARLTGAPPLSITRRHLDELILVGDCLTDAGILLPSNAFAIYRKRST